MIRTTAALAFLVLTVTVPPPVLAGCEPEPVTPNTPTGIAGCVIYGEGTASTWGGPGIARNDCVWPWLDCQPIRITSLQTGLWVEVTPVMFCDCYTGTPNERIVDLPPDVVAALGLDPAAGLWPVTVEPVGSPVLDVGTPDPTCDPACLPNTAVTP